MENTVYTAVNRLMQINRAHKHLIDSQVAGIGIHRTQHRILMYLSREGGLPSQKKLAERFEITPASVTGAVQRLEHDGYIKRKQGADNRFNEIAITEKGKEIVERTRALFSAVDDSLFAGFSEAEIEAVSAYLARMIDNAKGEDK